MRILDNEISIKDNAKPYKVLLVGNPLIRKKSKKIINICTPELKHIVQRLFATIYEFKSGIGLAAPQVGELIQLFIYHVPKSRSIDCSHVPWTVVINPKITILDNVTSSDYEGCFCLKDVRGKVSRYMNVKMDYYDLNGVAQSVNASGLHARLIQHEYDHLQGKLVIDRVKSSKDIGFQNEIAKLSKC